ncbi:unnamed protein product [Pleuronectes platessa]|uniref:Uncharacterized protein n=1 Tax=Pleuronectes platessa TaxID=8262 RepID=A0A9N7VXN7_PLEPL|nr:unnamed protein product [Pleuronectes platessa]
MQCDKGTRNACLGGGKKSAAAAAAQWGGNSLSCTAGVSFSAPIPDSTITPSLSAASIGRQTAASAAVEGGEEEEEDTRGGFGGRSPCHRFGPGGEEPVVDLYAAKTRRRAQQRVRDFDQ